MNDIGEHEPVPEIMWNFASITSVSGADRSSFTTRLTKSKGQEHFSKFSSSDGILQLHSVCSPVPKAYQLGHEENYNFSWCWLRLLVSFSVLRVCSALCSLELEHVLRHNVQLENGRGRVEWCIVCCPSHTISLPPRNTTTTTLEETSSFPKHPPQSEKLKL